MDALQMQHDGAGMMARSLREPSDDVDTLINAFHKTELDDASKQERSESEAAAALLLMTGHDYVESKESVVESKASPVDVYIAPAVLGHRWVRSRSTAHVVERPERLRACLLGLSALVGQLYETSGTADLVKDLGNLSVDQKDSITNSKEGDSIVRALISDERMPLLSGHRGLHAIHAHDDERLTSSEIGDAPEYAVRSAIDIAWPTQVSAPYVDILRSLCHAAPTHQPAPLPPPRSVGKTRAITDDGLPPRLPPAQLSDGSFASEVPVAWPQGDLYLCGKQDTDFFGVSVKEEHGAHIKIESADDSFGLPQTPPPKALHHAPSNESEFLRDGSLGAIEASLGTCCAALDRVVASANGRTTSSIASIRRADLDNLHQTNSVTLQEGSDAFSKRAFVLARPPGHHCTSNRPSGFCWVNNVAVMAAHAYAMHDIDRIAVLDFDLHHGDGTQAIVWRINAETVQRDASRKAQIDALMSERHSKPRHVKGAAAAVVPPVTESLAEIEAKVGKRGLKMFYGSLHDIESFPCELGDKDKVYDASVCIEGAHGQWIWNVHLDSHAGSPTAFQNAYEQKYAQLLQKARRFFEQTESVAQRSLLIISAGFDACVHEHAGMQRHGKSVPTSFYTRFTRDVLALADSFAQGKCVSVLEGGYSDRALTSGVAAHLVGLAGLSDEQSNDICQSTTLAQLERIGKLSAASMIAVDAVANATGNAFGEPTAQHLQRKRQELGPRDPEWLKHALEAFKRLQEHCGSTRAPPIPTVTAPSTPFGEELWRTPRKTRSMRNLAQSAKASPMK